MPDTAIGEPSQTPDPAPRLRIFPHRIMRFAPYFYILAIALLAIWGGVEIHRVALDSQTVIAQSQLSPETAFESPGGNRSYVVKRTSPGSPVQVNLSTPPASNESPGKAPSLEDLKRDLDNLKWVLTLILAAAGLFTVVQGIAAGFSAQNFQKQAEDAIKRLEKETDRALADVQRQSNEAFKQVHEEFQRASQDALQDLNNRFKAALEALSIESTASLKSLKELESQVRTLYPLFERDRLHAFTALRDHIAKFSLVKNSADGFDHRRRFYERMPLGERQEILAVDRALAYEIAGQNDAPELFAEQARQLAQFYWSKFIYERGLGFGAWSDLERAEHLLELGMKRAPGDEQFQFLNVLGNVRLERHKARMASANLASAALSSPGEDPNLANARACYARSIELHPNQLRAFHNLAVVFMYYNYASDDTALVASLQKAAELLQLGLTHQNWEIQPIPEFRCGTLYNLACIHARLAVKEPSQRDQHVEAFLRNLQAAADLGFIPQEDVEYDYDQKAGDIYPLLHPEGTGSPAGALASEEICNEGIRRKVFDLKEKLYRNAPEKI